MGIQRTAATVVTVMLVAGVLAGCVSPTPVPPPPTQEEIAAMREARAQDWWDSMSTGTTMPDVALIEEIQGQPAAFARQTQCLDEANIPGVVVYGPAEWSYNATLGDDPDGSAAQLQWWVCSQQYVAAGDFSWMLSPAQLGWVYDFLSERHIPCLRTLGFEEVGFPSRREFLDASAGYPRWLPYPESLQPTPPSSEWVLIAKRCPLPELFDDYGIPGYPGTDTDTDEG